MNQTPRHLSSQRFSAQSGSLKEKALRKTRSDCVITAGLIVMVLSGSSLLCGCHHKNAANDGMNNGSKVAEISGTEIPKSAFAPAGTFPSQVTGVEIDRIVENPYTGLLVQSIQPYIRPTTNSASSTTSSAQQHLSSRGTVGGPQGSASATNGPSVPGWTDEPVSAMAAWEKQGLRVISVPRSNVSSLMAGMVSEPLIDRTLMGVVPEWRAIATGPTLNAPEMVRISNQIVNFNDGAFRLLMRAYPLNTTLDENAGSSPSQPASPSITRRPRGSTLYRIELIVQFHQPRTGPLIADPYGENLQGEFISQSAAAFNLDADHALMVTAESPDVSWIMPDASDEAHQQYHSLATDQGASKKTGDKTHHLSPIPGERMGPPGPTPRTVAEEAMVSESGDRRIVVFIVPRVPTQPVVAKQ